MFCYICYLKSSIYKLPLSPVLIVFWLCCTQNEDKETERKRQRELQESRTNSLKADADQEEEEYEEDNDDEPDETRQTPENNSSGECVWILHGC